MLILSSSLLSKSVTCNHIGRVTSLRLRAPAGSDVIIDSIIVADVTNRQVHEVIVDGSITTSFRDFNVKVNTDGISHILLPFAL